MAKKTTKTKKSKFSFKEYYSDSTFRICTASRLVQTKPKEEGLDLVAETVNPCEEIAIEILDKNSYSLKTSEKNYLVIAFVKYESDDNEIVVEEVDNRVHDLSLINKIRYIRIKKIALNIMVQLQEENK